VTSLLDVRVLEHNISTHMLLSKDKPDVCGSDKTNNSLTWTSTDQSKKLFPLFIQEHDFDIPKFNREIWQECKKYAYI
jgi:hypothetical protein